MLLTSGTHLANSVEKRSAVKFTGNVHLVRQHSAYLYLLYMFHIYHCKDLKSHTDYRAWTQLQGPSAFKFHQQNHKPELSTDDHTEKNEVWNTWHAKTERVEVGPSRHR